MTAHKRPSCPSGMVQDMEGVRETVLPLPPHVPGNATQVVVQLESGQQVVTAAAFMQYPDGSYSLPLRLTALLPIDRAPGSDAGAPLVLPVMVAELDVHTRRVETGTARMTKRVQEREVLVDEPLWRDEVDSTRGPGQRVVDGPMPVRYEGGDTRIVSLLQEVLVVEKQRRLTKDLHSRTQRVETHQSA